MAQKPQIILGWEIGMTHGWGIHGYHLMRRIMEQGIYEPVPLGYGVGVPDLENMPKSLNGVWPRGLDLYVPVIWCGHNRPSTGEDFKPVGPYDWLIHVFEDITVTQKDLDFLSKFNGRIITVSQWNADILRNLGITANCAHLGIDTKMFKPKEQWMRLWKNRFTIFSAGKLELRKGQDIVVAAFKIFKQRHPEAMLVTNWHNHWPETAQSLVLSPHTKGVPKVFGVNTLKEWVGENGISSDDYQDMGILDRASLVELLDSMDVALFPNRCEGGTNMAAMECIAAGVPTILSANTGHLDLIADGLCSFELKTQRPTRDVLKAGLGGTAVWQDSDIDEILQKLEMAYRMRNDSRSITEDAVKNIQAWNWDSKMDAQIAAMGLDVVAPPRTTGVETGRMREVPGAVTDTKVPAMPVQDPVRAHSDRCAQLAIQLRDLGFQAAAKSLARRAINLCPDNHAATANLGNVMITDYRPGEARELLEKAMKMATPKMNPELRAGYNQSLGISYFYAGQYEKALKHLAEAAPLNPEAAWDHALLLMLTGAWEEGWEKFEVRHKTKHNVTFDMPSWDGKKVGTLWVTCEQGLGDNIQFARYLLWAREHCDKLIFSVYPKLMSVFYGYPGIDELRVWDNGVPDPEADAQCWLMSLPRFHKTRIDTIPQDPQWFKHLAGSIRGDLTTGQPNTLKVGIVWAGSKKHARDRDRSIALETFLPLTESTRAQIFSFQVGDRAQDIENSGATPLISDISEKLVNWNATAVALSKLDLLITVDTAVAHMAGAVGVRTWLLCCKVPEWRWLIKRTDTPWYPSMKLYRQALLGDWDEVISRVCVDMDKLARKIYPDAESK